MDAIEEVAPIKNNAKEIFVNATADNGDNAVSDVVKVSESSSDTTRVGRWMSLDEYDKMVESGKVQMSGEL